MSPSEPAGGQGIQAGGAEERARAIRVPIRIRRVTLSRLERRMTSSLGSALPQIASHRSVLVKVEDEDGATGWGEASQVDLPAYAADSLESSWHALTQLLAPRAVGVALDGPAAAAGQWADVGGHHYAKHALESAIWALASERLGRPLSVLWGGVRDSVPVGESFGTRETIGELLAAVEAKLAEGYCRVKLKIRPGWDVAPARAVASRFPGVPVSADANCHYRERSELPHRELDELGLQMLEQPLPADDLAGLADLQASLRTPVCLDESASSPGITLAALRLGSGRIVNVKPARLGGLLASLRVHDLCGALSVPVWCGGILESGIGRGFNLALCSLPNFTLPADMSPARDYFEEDLVEPTYDIRPDGTMAVPSGLGCGFTVREDRIRRYTTATWTSPG